MYRIATEVVDEAAIVPDEAIDETSETAAAETTPPPSSGSRPAPQPPSPAPAPETAAKDADARLSVFADFFDQIAGDQPDGEDQSSEGQTHDDE